MCGDRQYVPASQPEHPENQSDGREEQGSSKQFVMAGLKDGERLLMIRETGNDTRESEIIVVQNWFEGLRPMMASN